MLKRHRRTKGSLRSYRVLIGHIVVVFGLACCMTARAQTTKPRADNQIWTETQLAIPLDKKVNLVVLGIVRFGRDVSRPVNERIGAGVSFKAGKYLTLFPFYLHLAAQPTSTSHSTEDRITLEAALKFPVRRLMIGDRNRVEFHNLHSGPSFTQYRNRMQLEPSAKLTRFKIEPFVADEVFYDSIAKAWIRNRFYLGAIKRINKHFIIELYYVRQNDSHSHPGDINALGSTFKFHL